MEELVKYIGENQMLFYVIGVCFVLAIILVLAIKLFSHIPENEEGNTEEKESDKLFLESFHTEKEKENFLTLINDSKEQIEPSFEEFEIKNESQKDEKEVSHFEESLNQIPDHILNFESPEEVKVTPIEIHHENLESGSELDILLNKMQEDIQDKKVDPIQSFEELQEENAIISYEELLRVSGKEPVMSAEEEESQPIIMSVRELEARNKKEEIEKPVVQEKPVNEEKIKKFKNTDFISPVYGKINSNSLEYPKIPAFKKEEKTILEEDLPLKEDVEELILVDSISNKHENTVEVSEHEVFDGLTDEMRRNEEFLQALKEFRKNL